MNTLIDICINWKSRIKRHLLFDQVASLRGSFTLQTTLPALNYYTIMMSDGVIHFERLDMLILNNQNANLCRSYANPIPIQNANSQCS